MSDAQWLFVVVVALYGWECACWLRRGGVVFSSWLGKEWKASHPSGLIANQAGGFVFAPPLPPLGTIFVARQFPLSLSASGALAFVSTNVNPGWRPAQHGRFVRFEGIRELRTKGRTVMVNGEVLVTCATPALARWAISQLQKLIKLEPAQRPKAIAEFCRESLDAIAASRKIKEFTRFASPIRILSNILVGYVFLVIPVVIWNLGLKLSWLWLLLGLIGLTSATAIRFLRAHRALYPEAEEERFTHTLTIVLAPTTAMRAVDALSRPLLETFHPLAVAKALLPPKEFEPFAARIWLDLLQPALPHVPADDPNVREVELDSRRAWRDAAEQMLKRSKIEVKRLSAPPTRTDESCRAYCPRCQAQFTKAEGSCADCGGLPLKCFEGAA